jgi:hypothetical protein
LNFSTIAEDSHDIGRQNAMLVDSVRCIPGGSALGENSSLRLLRSCDS